MAEKLTEMLRSQINIAEVNIRDLKVDITKARAIGLDVKALELELKKQESQVKLVKDVYAL